MSRHTEWVRVYPEKFIGKRFFDSGNYGFGGFFTIIEAYCCKVYCKYAVAHDGTHWFERRMIVVKTDDGLTYRVPFLPWWEIYTYDGKVRWSDLYDAAPW